MINFYYYANALSVVNVAPGIFSKKTESNELTLPATSTFEPITTLTTNIHIDKPYSAFVQYQITMETPNIDFYSKLLINHANAGSLVHSGNQTHKTATGFYMTNLNPGHYRFEVHYKSPVAINMSTSYSADWQTAILQIMWFEDAYVVSDGIECHSIPAINTYNIWGSLNGIETILSLPSNRAVLSAYQFSTEVNSTITTVTSLEVDGFHQNTATLLQGYEAFLGLYGTWARNMKEGSHYFGIQYRTHKDFSFTDCKEKYTNNKNLYAMMLPPSCRIAAVINPKTKFSLSNSNRWATTDLIKSFTLSKRRHVIVMYQYAGRCGNSYIVMRLSIDSIPQQHTVSLAGDMLYIGNFGLWQGSLNKGTHKIALEYRATGKTDNIVSSALEWTRWNKWMNRAMTVIIC